MHPLQQHKDTRETCFKLHGYPEWWNDFQARKKREGTSTNEDIGRAAIASAEHQLSLTIQPKSTNPFTTLNNQGNCGQVLVTCHGYDEDMWIIDSGATDHMTFDPHDFSHITQPRRTCIANANGVQYPVTGVRTVTLSSSLSFNHTLLVPSLSNKLLYVSQVTTDLSCVILMYPTFCLLQDILIKEIIGRGTKKKGLYYMDDFSSGKTNHLGTLVIKNGKFGFFITAWDTILLGICSISFQSYFLHYNHHLSNVKHVL